MKILKFEGVPFRQIRGVRTFPDYFILTRDHELIPSTKEETDLIQEIWNRLEQKRNDF